MCHSVSSSKEDTMLAEQLLVKKVAGLPGCWMESSYMPANQDEFGFDPPDRNDVPAEALHSYDLRSCHNDLDQDSWSEFAHEIDNETTSGPPTQDHDELTPPNLFCMPAAISHSGQLTPPRSNSLCSIDNTSRRKEVKSSKSAEKKHRRPSKPQAKHFKSNASKSCGRTWRGTRRVIDCTRTAVDPKDFKRKLSLEKNRLAAAKCRSNKKQHIEQLQRRSHEEAARNVSLKAEVMRMKEHVQQIIANLLRHAAHDACESPGEILRDLSQLEQVSLIGRTSPPGHDLGCYAPVISPYPLQADQDAMSGDCDIEATFLNHDPPLPFPPLPEFNICRSRNVGFDAE